MVFDDYAPPRHPSNRPPPRPKMRHQTGITDTSDRDYSMIEKIETVNRSRSTSRAMSRGRSSSRVRRSSSSRGRSTSRVRDSKPEGGILSRDRSQSRPREERRERSESRGRGRGRSKSKSRLRSLSKKPLKMLRSISRGRQRTSEEHENKLKPKGRGIRRSLSRVFKGKRPPEPEPREQPEHGFASEDTRMTETVFPSEEDVFEPQESDIEDPEGLTSDDVMQLDERNTNLHVVCLLHRKSSSIIRMINDDTQLAFEPNSAGELPLHYAAMDKEGVEPDVLDKLIEVNPDAVRYCNVQGSLPIHAACMVGAPSQYALKTLINLYPESVLLTSEIPLLFEKDMLAEVEKDTYDDDTVFENNNRDITKAQVNIIASFFACATPVHPELKERNMQVFDDEDDFGRGPKIESGWTPLHLAVMNGASSDIIGMLLDANLQCAFIKTTRGRTALDCAQYIVRQHWLYGTDDESAIQNTFAAIEILEELAAKQADEEDNSSDFVH